MPSPVGHSLMGYVLYRAFTKPGTDKSWKWILVCIFMANAPDLDFIPGLIVGEPNRYHHGISHSFGFALVASAGVAWVYSKRSARIKTFGVLFSLYTSHLFLDYCGRDTKLPYGEPLFWPVSGEYFILPFSLFFDIQRSSAGAEFFPSLFSLHNLWAVGVECVVLLPAIFLVQRLNSTRKLQT